MKLHQSFQLFFEHCQYEKLLSKKTIQAYQIDLQQFNSFLELHSIAEITLIDKAVIKAFVQNLSKYKTRTIKRKIACTKTFLNFLEFEDYIPVNPYRKVKIRIKDPQYLPSVLECIEVEKLFRTIKKRGKNIEDPTAYAYGEYLRDLSIMELLFATGIRVSELCGLRLSDINLCTGNFLIKGKGNKERLIQVCHPETLLILKDYFKFFESKILPNGFFFVSKLSNCISTQSVRFLVKKYCRLANITKNVTPHTFRHTFATLLLEQDVDIKYIQHLLGHSSINTTQIYTHVNQKKQSEILSTKHPRHLFVLDGV